MTATTPFKLLLNQGGNLLLNGGGELLLHIRNIEFGGTVALAHSLPAGLAVPKPPPAPTNFVATRSTDFATVNLSWSAVPGATGYEILRGSDYRAQPSVIDTVTELTYEDTGLTATTNYSYSVRAVNATMGVDGLRSLLRYLPRKNDVING